MSSTLASVGRGFLTDVLKDIQLFHIGKAEGSSRKGETCECKDLLPQRWCKEKKPSRKQLTTTIDNALSTLAAKITGLHTAAGYATIKKTHNMLLKR